MATADGKPNISAQQVKELRDRTGVGFAACREALVEAGGDIERAIDLLRKKGQATRGQEGAAGNVRGIGELLHSRGRENRRADRSELRERFRRAHR